MGGTQSKIENEEAVARCKERKRYMKEAVAASNAFAAAHISYTNYLKWTGGALSDFIYGEVQNLQSASGSAALPSNAPIPEPIPLTEIPLPPPLLPDFSPSPLQRAATMPEIKMTMSETTPVGTIVEEEEENEMENEGSVNGGLRSKRSSRRRSGTKEATEEADRRPIPPPSSIPEPQGLKKRWQGQVSIEGKRIVISTRNLIQIFAELDDDFLKASESAHEVSKMLEATRLHYHSNFADNRGNSLDNSFLNVSGLQMAKR